MDSSSLHTLQEIVQRNCHISDARHAADYTLCIYLLKMREYFRWEQGLKQTANLPGDEVGAWLTEREQLWDDIEDQDYQPLTWAGSEYDPFDVEGINEALASERLVYSAGYGVRGAAHFFLADRESDDFVDGAQVLVSGREYARDLTSPPAMSLGSAIFIRRESFRRMLWERVQESRWSRCETPMTRAIQGFDFDTDPEAVLDAMTHQQIELLKLHELGEQKAEALLGLDWPSMLLAVLKTKLEFQLRAVRDFLADCHVTLPHLLSSNAPRNIHFYFASLTPAQKELFPALISAYEHWLATKELGALESIVAQGRSHWLSTARELIEVFQSGGSALDESFNHTLSVRIL